MPNPTESEMKTWIETHDITTMVVATKNYNDEFIALLYKTMLASNMILTHEGDVLVHDGDVLTYGV